ncbi:MAG: NAD-dependent epimerase/dehydratase family protein [Lachnospiraceae bacterium]|nr:NAD-dependent epimerase/dehydratase family protein [Lachnospiraceae bacterium]
MELFENELYQEDVQTVASLSLPWDFLKNRSILISGAGGLIGSFLVDVIMQRNHNSRMNCRVFALGRNEEKAHKRFAYCIDDNNFQFISHDINQPLEVDGFEQGGYVLHLASNTPPLAYTTDPIGAVTTNIIGTHNLLRFSTEKNAKRFVFASSNEIYGENRGNVEFFDEKYCGYIDSNTMRAGYPESKRCGEALCQAYIRQEGLEVVIPRFTRSYGPTMLMSDTKAISQFIRKGIAGENIVLKSEGTQYYSYTYVADAVSGLLTVLLCGNSGEAYNIADQPGDIMLKNLAAIIADQAGTNVVYELPDDVEKKGYSTATKARLDGSKLKKLGWSMKYDVEAGVKRTLHILKSMG